MKEARTQTRELGTQTVSRVVDGSTLVELVYDAAAQSTVLAILDSGEIRRVGEWRTTSGELLIPLRPDHGLLKHGVVLFPSGALDYESKVALRRDIERYIASYVTLSPVFLALASHYVLYSWLYDAFQEAPYLRFKGDFGTGKTRALQVVGSICYKPIFASGASTVSPIFHALDLFRGTLVFDEADFRFSDEKAEITKILNSGTTKGFPVLRSRANDKKDFEPRAFEVFGPKLVSMRESFEDYALESRFFTEAMRGSTSEGVPINLPESQKQEALNLRNKLLMFRFREWQQALVCAQRPENYFSALSARSNQLLSPILTLVDDPHLAASFAEFALLEEDEGAASRSIEEEALVLDAILRLIHRKPGAKQLPLQAIRDEAARAHSGEFDRPLSSRRLGALIRNKLRMKSFKSGVYLVVIPDEQALDALCHRYRVTHKEKR